MRRRTRRNKHPEDGWQRRGQLDGFNDAAPLRREIATYKRVIMPGGVVVVMVAVESFFKRRRCLLGDGEVMMPLGQVKRRHDKARPREHQPEKGQNRRNGSKPTHSIDAMSPVTIAATAICGWPEGMPGSPRWDQAVVKTNAIPWLPLALRQFVPIIVHATPA